MKTDKTMSEKIIIRKRVVPVYKTESIKNISDYLEIIKSIIC